MNDAYLSNAAVNLNKRPLSVIVQFFRIAFCIISVSLATLSGYFSLPTRTSNSPAYVSFFTITRFPCIWNWLSGVMWEVNHVSGECFCWLLRSVRYDQGSKIVPTGESISWIKYESTSQLFEIGTHTSSLSLRNPFGHRIVRHSAWKYTRAANKIYSWVWKW